MSPLMRLAVKRQDRVGYVNHWLDDGDHPHPCGQLICDQRPACLAWWGDYRAQWDIPWADLDR